MAALLLMVGGAYLLLLTQSPALPLPVTKTEVKAEPNDGDVVMIEKVGIKVPFAAGPDARVLDKGAWWRYPERGDPEKGGNFILSAHRFQLALTPWSTKNSSPFYHLDDVKEGDIIKVHYKGKWYSYETTKVYSVAPDAVKIEAPSEEAKLTLYSCSLRGEADGRVVVEAKPV